MINNSYYRDFKKGDDGKVVWFTDFDKARAEFNSKAYVVAGVVKWKNNNRVPPDGILDIWKELNLPFDFDKSKKTSEAQSRKILREYRESMKNHVPSAEELFEMRAAFGTGVTVVNAITGKKTRL
jgi:hypothetical protein